MLVIERATIWDMNDREQAFLGALPEVVEVWHVNAQEDEGEGLFYLSRERGLDGLCSLAQAFTFSKIERGAVRRTHIVAVDLERYAAQVVFEPEE